MIVIVDDTGNVHPANALIIGAGIHVAALGQGRILIGGSTATAFVRTLTASRTRTEDTISEVTFEWTRQAVAWVTNAREATAHRYRVLTRYLSATRTLTNALTATDESTVTSDVSRDAICNTATREYTVTKTQTKQVTCHTVTRETTA